MVKEIKFVLWFLAFYLSAVVLDTVFRLGITDGEIVVCGAVCGLIAMGLAYGWTPGPSDNTPQWLRGRRF